MSGFSRTRAAVLLCLLPPALAACASRPPSPGVGVPAPPAATLPAPSIDPVAQLRTDLVAATRLPGVQRGSWGVVVHSLDRDERLLEMNPDALLVPASTAKVVSVAAAAEAVGWNYRYETTLRTTGPVENGVIRGDLVIVGSGDPSIGGRAGTDLTEWAESLKASGIRRVEGRVVGDDDAIEEPRPQLAWAWDDLGYTTGAIFGALNLAENRMTVTVTPGAAEGLPAGLSVEPHAAYRPLANRTITAPLGATQLLWPEQRPGEPFLTIAGFIAAGSQPVRINIAVGNPTLWFASVLRYRLLHAGIEVTGDAWDIDDLTPRPDTAAATVLLRYRSPTLAELTQPLLKESINLYAEAALRLNAPPGTFPTNDAALEGLKLRMQEWGIPADAQQLVDGSGLSRRNVISPEALLDVLRRMYEPTATSPFMISLPVAGRDGSLANRMRATPAEGNVRAKTGTMSNIRSLAGFATTRDGERLAFVIMVNNFEGGGITANQAIDEMAVRLVSFTRSATAPPASVPPASR